MARIIDLTTTNNPQTKFQNADVKNYREPDFAELHALFEIQFKQFLTDTNDEIAKRAQRLLELESIVYGNRSTG